MIAKVLFIIVIFAAIGIVALVLLQKSSGDTGSAFGGGGSQSMFGSRGSGNFLSRLTSILVTLFFAGSLGLAYTYAKQSSPDAAEAQEESVLNSVEIESDLPVAPEADLEVPAAPVEEATPSEVPSVPE